MHIAFAGRLVLPLTGAELVPLELLRELIQLQGGHRYSLFLGEPAALAVGFQAPNLTLWPYASFWQKPIPNIVWHQVWLPWLILRQKVDVLFVAHNRAPVWKTCPQVVILHDLAEFHVERKYDAARSLYRRLALGGSVRRSERVVTVSESSKRDIHSFLNVPSEKIVVIPNALPTGLGGATDDPAAAWAFLAARYNLPPEYVLYVGAIEHPNKNLVRLLEAFRLVRDRGELAHHLVLAGPKRWRPEVVFEAVDRLGLGSVVHWLGYVPEADLRRLYAGADLFVYVSLWEGFGLPVLEAMAHGVPVVTSNTSSLPEVVGEAGLLVDPGDTARMADVICLALTDRELNDRLRREGRERARQFSWRASAQRLLEVFQTIWPEPAAPR